MVKDLQHFFLRLPREDRYEIAAYVLVVAAPLIAFLRYNSYPIIRPETLLFLIVLMAAGGLVGFWSAHAGRPAQTALRAFAIGTFFDFQFSSGLSNIALLLGIVGVSAGAAWYLRQHFAQIVCAIFATFIISTLLLPVGVLTSTDERLGNRSPNKDLPLVVHLVLDEHIGVEAIPSHIPGAEETRSILKSVFAKHGFRTYGKAHSEFFYTQLSLSRIANLTNGRAGGFLTTPARLFEVRLSKSSYFERMIARGYRVSIFQSDYMDFCSAENAKPDRCYLYRPFPLTPVAAASWPWPQKLRVVAGVYLTHALLYKGIRQVYDMVASGLRAIGFPVPNWNWELSRVAPLGVFDLFSILESELAKAQRGEFFFAHLLLPHSPFSYRSDCTLKPPSEWLERRDRVRPWARSNTQEARAVRYAAYLEQVQCVARRLDRLMTRLEQTHGKDDLVVIIHGDHGSRINRFDPRERHRKALTAEDFIDNYATLLTVKAPGVPAGYDLWRVSIQSFLASFIALDFHRLPHPSDIPAPPTIYLTAAGRKITSQVPMPDFGPSSTP